MIFSTTITVGTCTWSPTFLPFSALAEVNKFIPTPPTSTTAPSAEISVNVPLTKAITKQLSF